jgi:hypothetical protein
MTRAALTRTQAVSAAFTSVSQPRSVAGRAVGGRLAGNWAVGYWAVGGRAVGGRAARVTSRASFRVACVTVAAEYFGLETRLFLGVKYVNGALRRREARHTRRHG